jgi:hypothetical protein
MYHHHHRHHHQQWLYSPCKDFGLLTPELPNLFRPEMTKLL